MAAILSNNIHPIYAWFKCDPLLPENNAIDNLSSSMSSNGCHYGLKNFKPEKILEFSGKNFEAIDDYPGKLE